MKSKNSKNIFTENLKSKQKSPQLSIETQFQLAASFHQQGRLEEASVLYKTVLSSKPNHADALHEKVKIGYHLKFSWLSVHILLPSLFSIWH